VTLNFCHDLLCRLVIRVPIFACGRRTGVPVNGLVSGQEQNTTALEALNARIGVVWVAPIFGGWGYVLG
jgi:hypothetical protein